MNICFTILILLLLSACTVYSQQEDDQEPATSEPSIQNTEEQINSEPQEQNPERNIKESFDENLNVQGPENDNNIEQDNETAPANINTGDNEATAMDTVFIQTPNSEEKITKEELNELSTLKGESLSKAINDFSQDELKALSEIPKEELAKILKIPEQEAKTIQEEIINNTVKPFDKTPIKAPEAVTSIPVLGTAIDVANNILTAGLDMTPKQRKKAQMVIIIILICVILPESYRQYISKNKNK